jgi:hypothetical protein
MYRVSTTADVFGRNFQCYYLLTLSPKIGQLKEAEVGNLQPKSIESAQLQMLRTRSGQEAIVLDNLAKSLTDLISTVEIHKQEGTPALE